MNRNYCRRGHDLTAPYSTYDDGTCVNCVSAEEFARLSGLVPKRKAKPKPNSAAAMMDEQWRVQRILEIGKQLDRNPMPWERDALVQEFQRLRDLGVEA